MSLTKTILLHVSVHATHLLSTYAHSPKGSFYNIYLICMGEPRVCVTSREISKYKSDCVAILTFFFLLSDWNVQNAATR